VLERRTPLYERMAHVSIDTDGRSLDELARSIAQRFQAALAQGTNRCGQGSM
jgi:shikimate kinase